MCCFLVIKSGLREYTYLHNYCIAAAAAAAAAGIEGVVFIAGVGNAKPTSIPLAAFVGILLGVLAGEVYNRWDQMVSMLSELQFSYEMI